MKNKYLLLLLGFLIQSLLFASSVDQEAFSVTNDPAEIRVLDNDFRQLYTDEDYNYQEKDPSFLTRVKEWILAKIRSLFNTSSEGASDVLNIIVNIIYILIIAFAIFFIARMILNKEGRWLFSKKDKDDNIEYSSVEENIAKTNFEDLIAAAIHRENYRLAVRYYYLWLLKKLDHASIIEYDPQKTNIDYQIELNTSKFAEDFVKVSYYYSYIWYGEFEINKSDYSTTSSVYERLIKQIDNE